MGRMKRRTFLSTSLAATVATALPLPVTQHQAARTSYVWGVAMAKSRGRLAVADLRRDLKLGHDAAAAMFRKLQQRGVLAAPDAAGIARTIGPVFQAGARVAPISIGAAARATKPAAPSDLAKQAVDHVSRMAEQAADPAPQEASDAAHSTE